MRLVALLSLIALSSQAYAQSTLEDAANKPQMYRLEYGELTLGTFHNGQRNVVNVGPGLYFNESASVALAAKLEGNKAEIAALKKALNEVPPSAPPTWVIVGCITLGVLVGGASMMLVRK